MKQFLVIFSFIFIILGICIITISKIIEEVIPKLGFAAYQSAAAGSYTPDNYHVNFELNYWIGAICILSGIVYLISKTNFIQNYINEVKLRNKKFDERNKNNHE
ncbi:MAG TPA: hypothetical protein DEF35_22505 [Paenibacillus sp.]|uniref:hypothetical protein n=1 Tax=Paenibacillus TaxID=44249 RepID=UPI000BA09CD7|nr:MULTISPECIES: hypothetical protein [Paenibacillus]OZQ68143.1 hypothetical protein CA599_16125 [Paenibacillus taichungensis]HBU84389.1 hypothetical protein [Paenibacillus sp.]